jgi:predicted esterase
VPPSPTPYTSRRAFSLFSFASFAPVALAACAALALAGCSSEPEGGGLTEEPFPTSTIAESPQPAPAPTTPPGIAGPGITKPVDDPGPAPAGCGTVTKDKDGFFTRTNGAASYVGFVPKGYTGKPTTLVVGMHGCGDSAKNFATWAVAPYDTRGKAEYLGISIGGKDGQCWDTSADIAKVTAAIADMSSCFYVHQQKVVLAGYSSGGILAYKLGLTQSSKFAGIIIENSGLGGANPAGAAWKINVAHIAHKGDGSFPLAKTQADWAKLEAAGIPLQKKEVEGDHNGSSDDWNDFLLPKIGTWKAP